MEKKKKTLLKILEKISGIRDMSEGLIRIINNNNITEKQIDGISKIMFDAMAKAKKEIFKIKEIKEHESEIKNIETTIDNL